MTTEERLEKLERKIEEMQTEIRTKKLCILDDQGQEHIKLAVVANGTILSMFDENGKPRAKLKVNTDGSRLVMWDENGKPRANLKVNTDGPRLDMYDENGKPRVGMIVSKDAPRLFMTDENEMTRAQMSTGKDGPGLVMLDENGKPIWEALKVEEIVREGQKADAEAIDEALKSKQNYERVVAILHRLGVSARNGMVAKLQNADNQEKINAYLGNVAADAESLKEFRFSKTLEDKMAATAKVGARFIAASKPLNYSDWSAKMKERFGAGIEPYLLDVWDESSILIDNVIRET